MVELSFVTPKLEIKKNVIIVGSSAKVLGKKRGGLIDEHKEVIRFNRAVTKGHEIDVGTKTTLRVVNNHVFNNNDMGSAWGEQPRYFVRDLQNAKLLYVAEDLMPFWEREKNKHFSTEVFLFNYGAVPTMNIRFGLPIQHKPSVGVAIIMLCIVSGITPDVLGFDVEMGDERSHYWGARPKSSGYHKVEDEKKLLTKLDKQGIIKLYK
jgi:hypothetical protein